MKKISIGSFFILLPGFLVATTFRPLPDKEKFRSAELICAGKVLSYDSKSNARITIANVEILDCAKGQTESSKIQVRWPGGSKGSDRSMIPGLVYLQPGEIGVLYLNYQAKWNAYSLKAWQIEKLVEHQRGNQKELIFENQTSLLHSRQMNQQEKVKTWSGFKHKVQEELKTSP